MGSRIAALGTFMKWRDEIGSVGKNAFRGVFYFMSFSVTLSQMSSSPALLLCLFIPFDLNNETPVFCLLAVLLYTVVAREECLDNQSLSQRTLLHRRRRWIFFFLEQCHLDRITRMGFRVSPGVTVPRFVLSTLMWYVM